MNMMSVCGVNCQTECRAFGTECAGCNELSGAVSWAKFIGRDVCPIYACVHEKHYVSCAGCSELPCGIWLNDTKNPSMTDQEYRADIERRIRNLKGDGKR